MSDSIRVTVEYGKGWVYGIKSARPWQVTVRGPRGEVRTLAWTHAGAKLLARRLVRNVQPSRSYSYEIPTKAEGDAMAERIAKLEQEVLDV